MKLYICLIRYSRINLNGRLHVCNETKFDEMERRGKKIYKDGEMERQRIGTRPTGYRHI